MKEIETNPEATPVEAKAAEVKPEAVATAHKPDATAAEPKPEAKAGAKPESDTKKPSDLTPQLVKRVHELYAQLGREEVRAVLAWEHAEEETPENATKAEPKPVAEAAEPKPEAKTAEPKSEIKPAEPKPDATAAATTPEV
jgi:hypothetical protein